MEQRRYGRLTLGKLLTGAREAGLLYISNSQKAQVCKWSFVDEQFIPRAADTCPSPSLTSWSAVLALTSMSRAK
jgi:hypothetical protein